MRAAIILAVSFLVLLIGGGARFAIGLTFKPMVDEFGWARGELGLAVALYMVVSALATPCRPGKTRVMITPTITSDAAPLPIAKTTP